MTMTREQFQAEYNKRLYRALLARVGYALWHPCQVERTNFEAERLYEAGLARREELSNGEYRYGLLAAYF